MPAGSSFEIKEQVKQAINIVDVVGDYLQLRREGRAYKTGAVPLARRFAPQPASKSRAAELQVLGLRCRRRRLQLRDEEMENMSFPEALEFLAQRAGIPLAAIGKSGRAAPMTSSSSFQAMAWAQEQYHQFFAQGPGRSGRAPVSQRAWNHRRKRADAFIWGSPPNDWEWILPQASGTRFTPGGARDHRRH